MAMTVLRGRKWLTGSYNSAVIQRRPRALPLGSLRVDAFMRAGSREGINASAAHVVEMREWS
jgi:hypothetical protein